MPGLKYDRSAEIMPTMGGDPLMRYTAAQPATPRYNDAAKMGMTPLPQQKPDFLDLDGDGNKTEPMTEAAKSKPLKRPLKGNQDKLPENLKKEILDAPPLARHMQFCGGMSKPYKKK